MFRPLLVLTLIPLQTFAITNIEEKRRAADADAPVPPQLVLPPKYRQSTVPLR